jgi:hypothetical protein
VALREATVSLRRIAGRINLDLAADSTVTRQKSNKSCWFVKIDRAKWRDVGFNRKAFLPLSER